MATPVELAGQVRPPKERQRWRRLTARPTESVRLERKSTSFGIYYSKVGYKINSLHNYLHILTSDTRILFFLPVWYTQTIFKGDGAIENI